jgi:hypothetical protein
MSRLNGRVESGLADLPKYDGAKFCDVEGRRAQGDQGLAVGFVEVLTRCPGNPPRQHRKRAACLLELRQGAPFSLEHRKRGRVERITGFKPTTQEIPRLAARRSRVCAGGKIVSPQPGSTCPAAVT